MAHRLNASDELALYVQAMSGDNRSQRQQLRRHLLRALEEDVTPRQREMLTLYYAAGLNIPAISRRLGVNKSTVSRTLHRGEARLRRCLRYGAGKLLRGD